MHPESHLGNGLSSWFPAGLVGDSDWVQSFQPQSGPAIAIVSKWTIDQQIVDLSLSAPLCQVKLKGEKKSTHTKKRIGNFSSAKAKRNPFSYARWPSDAKPVLYIIFAPWLCNICWCCFAVTFPHVCLTANGSNSVFPNSYFEPSFHCSRLLLLVHIIWAWTIPFPLNVATLKIFKKSEQMPTCSFPCFLKLLYESNAFLFL